MHSAWANRGSSTLMSLQPVRTTSFAEGIYARMCRDTTRRDEHVSCKLHRDVLPRTEGQLLPASCLPYLKGKRSTPIRLRLCMIKHNIQNTVGEFQQRICPSSARSAYRTSLHPIPTLRNSAAANISARSFARIWIGPCRVQILPSFPQHGGPFFSQDQSPIWSISPSQLAIANDAQVFFVPKKTVGIKNNSGSEILKLISISLSLNSSVGPPPARGGPHTWSDK